MEPAMSAVVALLCVLIVCIIVLVVFFVNHKSRPRSRSQEGVGSDCPGSSTRSRMAARWAHMEQGSLTRTAKDYQDEPEAAVVEVISDGLAREDLNEFGSNGGLSPGRAHSRSDHNSLVGTGPNGTRSFLKGWYGLDEPSFSGIKVSAEEKSVDGDVLPMNPPTAHSTLNHSDPVSEVSRFPHHRVPTTEDEVWETNSNPGLV